MAQVRLGAFVPALILAPLLPAIPAGLFFGVLLWLDSADNIFAALAAIIAFAVPVGAPTYLSFGAVSFWLAIRREALLWTSAIAANVISSPAVLIFFWITERNFGTAALSTLSLVVVGCIFAAIWGVIFEILYERFVSVADELKTRTNAAHKGRSL